MRNLALGTFLIFTAVTTLLGQARQEQPSDTSTSKATADFDKARSIVELGRKAALAITDRYQRGLILDQIGAAEAQIGDLTAAVETANLAYPHTDDSDKAIGERLYRSESPNEIQVITSKLKSDIASSVLYHIAEQQAEKGDIIAALRTASQIQTPEVRSGSLMKIAEKESASGDYAGARKTISLANAAYPAQSAGPEDVEMLIAQGQLARGDIEGAQKSIANINSARGRSAAMFAGADLLLKSGDAAHASTWLDDAFKERVTGRDTDFLQYMTIPMRVKLGQKDRAMQAASDLPGDLSLKGYIAIAVTCAETKDAGCVNAALSKVQTPAGNPGPEQNSYNRHATFLILHVTAALIDYGEFDVASHWLSYVEQTIDVSEPEVQLENVFLLALKGQFDAARALVFRIKPDPENYRGIAMRTVALRQASKDGAAAALPWAQTLVDSEDRANALIGIAQALLGTGEVKLPYSAIFVH